MRMGGRWMARAAAVGALLASAAAAPAGASGPAEVAVGGQGTAHFGFLRSDGDNLLLQDRFVLPGGGLSDPEYVSPGAGRPRCRRSPPMRTGTPSTCGSARRRSAADPSRRAAAARTGA